MKIEHLLTAKRLACVLALILSACSGNDSKENPGTSDGGGKQGDGGTTTSKACRPYCDSPSDCAQSTDKCVNHGCVQCEKDADCTIGPKKCDTSKGVCIVCLADTDCATVGIKKCDTTRRLCLFCTKDEDCAEYSPPGKCNTSTSFCVECTQASDCVTNQRGKYCESSHCINCKSDSDCTGTHYKGCNTTSGECNLCRSNQECCFPAGNCGQTCNSKGLCHCTSDSQCPVKPNVKVRYKCL